MSPLLERIRADVKGDIYYQQNFPNDGQRFLAWYLRNCCLRTPIQAKDDITDGPNDKEFDAIIVDDERRQVVIIQSKFYAGSVDHQPLQEVLAAWLQIQNLPALQASCNGKLQIKLETIAAALEDDYEVVFELLTTGELTSDAKNDLSAFQSTIAEFEHPQSSLTLVDSDAIQTRWTEAAGRELPKLSHTITLEPARYLAVDIANFRTVLAAIPLADCLKFPGISDGKLFRPNVRQSLGLTNKVNKGMRQTLNGDNPQYFFFYHNGITALCEKMSLDAATHQLKLDGLGVVNGCQSLTTLLSCSERVKQFPDARVLVRFYEIPQRDVADKISIYTNSQSAVKPRDLRSNDKRVLALKKAYEGAYPTGYLITKRGEMRLADRDEELTVDIALLAKWLMTWHCQRPNIAYNENRLFDKHFDQLFKGDYHPSDIRALSFWARKIEQRWEAGDLALNEALLASPSYSKFHLFYAVQLFFSAASNQIDKVPLPSATMQFPDPDALIGLAATCYNSALEAGMNEYQEKGKIFSPQNWLKAKDSLLKLQASVRTSFGFIGMMAGGAQMKQALVLPADRFGLRWVAD
ncbi:MAG TPA: AIPR family protein [Terriglobales bacterium]|nr:AIPR family protein [Terriglobales bacterium]